MRLITKMLGVLCGLVMAIAAPALAGNHFVTTNGTNTVWSSCVTTDTNGCTLATAAANAAAGDTVYLQVGTYNQTAQLTIAGDGTSTNGIAWEPYTSEAGDWDGTPGVVSLVGDGSFDFVRCNGEFNHFRGIKVTGSRAVHNRGWRITGDGTTLYRCVAYRTGSTGFLLAGAHNAAIQCEAYELGNSDSGAFGFKLQAYRATCVGCYAHDLYGLGYASSSSAGYDLGIYYSIAANVKADAVGTEMDGSGFAFQSPAGTDDLWGGTATQTQTALLMHCAAYNCAAAFEVGDAGGVTSLAQPLMLINCIADTCTTGVSSVYKDAGGTERRTALTLMGMGFYNCGTNIDDNSFVITRYAADTNFTASPFADAAGGDFRLAAAVTGWPTAFVSGGAMTSWAAYPQLGAVPKGASSGGGGTRSMRMGL